MVPKHLAWCGSILSRLCTNMYMKWNGFHSNRTPCACMEHLLAEMICRQKQTRLRVGTHEGKKTNQRRRYMEKTKAHTFKQTFGHISEMQVTTTAPNYIKCAWSFFRKSALFFFFAKQTFYGIYSLLKRFGFKHRAQKSTATKSTGHTGFQSDQIHHGSSFAHCLTELNCSNLCTQCTQLHDLNFSGQPLQPHKPLEIKGCKQPSE